MRTFSVVAVAAAMTILVACGNESAEGQPVMPSSGSSSPTPGTPEPTPEPTGPTPVPTTGPASAPVEQAKADLAKRLSMDVAQVTVVSSSEVTWSDGSLGCPEPGMNYTQALVPGFRVVLEAAGKQYHYHSGGTRPPFLCANPQG